MQKNGNETWTAVILMTSKSGQKGIKDVSE
jgi:hypothetical protein